MPSTPAIDSTPLLTAGGGRMGELTLAHDWAATPLGPIEAWPGSLRTAVGMLLSCQVPMYLAWGPGQVQFYNDAYVPILGPRHPDALGNPASRTWPELWPTIAPMWADVLAGRPIGYNDFRMVIERHGYPEEAYFSFSYSPVPDDDGRATGVLATVVETTERVFAERRARFQLELSDGLRGLDEPDAITESTCAALGKRLGVRRVGYATITPEGDVEISLRGWHDGSVPSVVGRTFPLRVFGDGIVHDLNAGRTVRMENIATDPRANAGTAVYDFLGVKAMLVVPLIRESRLIAVVAVSAGESRRWSDEDALLAEDAAERTRSAVERALAEQALKRREQAERDRLRSLFDQAPTFMAALRGPEHVFELTNPAYERLVGKRDFIGSRVCDVLRETVEQGFVRLLDEVYARGEPFVALDAPLLVEETPGAPAVQRYVDFMYQPIIEADGSVSGVFAMGSDVTQRHHAIDALRDADRRKDEFLAMLAHELRNPLAPISTAAQLLGIAQLDEARVRNAATIIGRQVAHMTHLVDDLLDVSRVTRGLIALEKELLDVGSVVDSAIEQVRPAIEARRHVLSVHDRARSVQVYGDRTRLVQVIVNLLSNAAKYTAEGGRIEIGIGLVGDAVHIDVRDTGIGIAPDLLPRVFDLFTQGERTPDRTHGGLGLGLALAKNLLELHGGRIAAHSAGLGLGSRFTAILPAATAAVDSNGAADAPTGARALPCRVLVVDDNVDAAETLAELLSAYGHDVAREHDAFAALATASRQRFDAFVLDIGLPGMDGYQLVTQLRAEPRHSHARFIALTGYGQPGDRVRSLAAGFDLHYVKPVDTVELAAALADAGTSRT